MDLYKSLHRKAEINGITLNLDDFCSSVGNAPEESRPLAKAHLSSSTAAETTPVSPAIALGIKPREYRVITFFKEGLTIVEMARSLSIKETTVQYVIHVP